MSEFDRQQVLKIQLNDFATFDNFVVGKNAELFSELSALLSGRGERFFYLWGNEGCGRSHLLKACCHQRRVEAKTCVYWDLSDPDAHDPSRFEGLEQLSLVCLDNIDVIAGLPEWEEGLFHLYNRILETQSAFIVAAPLPPSQSTLELPDLTSRLSAMMVYHVEELSDYDKISALQLRAAHKGLSLTLEVGQFLLNRCSRNMKDLYEVLTRLDEASLSAGRRLTVPFVKGVLWG